MSIKKHIPNFFTALNIVCGSIAIIYALQSDLLLAFYFICLAAFFDFIDGGVARLLKTQSEVGKQLDSLCDVVSFGVAPGVILFTMMRHALDVPFPLAFDSLPLYHVLLLLSMVLVPVFSAVRLAKFNVDTRQSSSFIGLPVPANALLIASLGVLFVSSPLYWLVNLLATPWVLLALSVFCSYLLISPLPMFALKFKNLTWKDNRVRFLFILLSILLIAFFGFGGISLVIIVYIFISLIIKGLSV